MRMRWRRGCSPMVPHWGALELTRSGGGDACFGEAADRGTQVRSSGHQVRRMPEDSTAGLSPGLVKWSSRGLRRRRRCGPGRCLEGAGTGPGRTGSKRCSGNHGRNDEDSLVHGVAPAGSCAGSHRPISDMDRRCRESGNA